MVAAARYADQYDGFLVGDPGFNLPLAAVANIYGAQQYARVDPANIANAWTAAERTMVSQKLLAKCDALDGLADGLIQDVQACQKAFHLDRDVPTCSGARDGTCLTALQKDVIGNIFAGARTSTHGPNFTLTSDVDALYRSLFARNDTYRQSSLQFMRPPEVDEMEVFRHLGRRMIVYHGQSDAIFSAQDTIDWYRRFNRRPLHDDDRGRDRERGRFPHDGQARLFLVPGMNHCGSGPTTDQFDALSPLVAWVESDTAPDRIVATARGPGNPGGVNAEVPAAWAPNRTRPLCPYPAKAIYIGGDVEKAASFTCR